jgi:hypothetical protein
MRTLTGYGRLSLRAQVPVDAALTEPETGPAEAGS